MAMTHQPKGTGSSLPAGSSQVYDAAGVLRTTKRRIIQVVGPASYASGGFLVDCSATGLGFFSRITGVAYLRRFITATGAGTVSRASVPVDNALYATGMFRVTPYFMGSHTHTYDKANTPTGGPSGAPTGLGGDNAHTHALTYTATASGAPSGRDFGEELGGTNLSTTTFEFEVEGVPL